jgi:hypothetical protein
MSCDDLATLGGAFSFREGSALWQPFRSLPQWNRSCQADRHGLIVIAPFSAVLDFDVIAIIVVTASGETDARRERERDQCGES